MNSSIRHAICFATLVVGLACDQTLRAQGQPIQYYYDDLGRLVTMVDSSGKVVTYTYDGVGNILRISRSTVVLGSLAVFDFNPHAGSVLATVTIRGQGFNATPASNIVKFNGLASTVISATTTTLVTSVPVGATTGPISVTVGANTASSSSNFVVLAVPVITSVWPKSALFNVVIPDFQVSGVNLLGATFSFSCFGVGPTVTAASVNRGGKPATLTISVENTAGTCAVVASNASGNSGTVPDALNRFTVVNPISTADTDGDGIPDVVEAAFGTDPLDPKSFPTPLSVALSGEVDGTQFSVLNTSGGTQPVQNETDGVLFSVFNTSEGTQPFPNETDGILFSVFNTSEGTQPVQNETDGVLFSVQNNAGSAKVNKETTSPTAAVSVGNDQTLPSLQGSGQYEGPSGGKTAAKAARQSPNAVPSAAAPDPKPGATGQQSKFENR
jgi:YD repeat-containing protein